MAIKLFEHPLSPYVQKVKIVLYEKGLPFERVVVDLNAATQDEVYQEFVLASPRREVPALVDGEVRLFDSTIIIEYLEERYRDRETSPPEAAERARVRMLEEMMDGEYEAVNWGIGEIKIFGRAVGDREQTLLTRAGLQLQRLWNRLDRELEGRPWFNGPVFGRGDAVVLPHLMLSQNLGYPVDDRRPKLADWLSRASERDSARRVIDEAREAFQRISADEVDRRAVVRQYRDYRLEWMFKTGGSDIVVDGLLNGSIRFADEFE
jgi:glutathione S-transferase/RNA polymerase-associated protein